MILVTTISCFSNMVNMDNMPNREKRVAHLIIKYILTIYLIVHEIVVTRIVIMSSQPMKQSSYYMKNLNIGLLGQNLK